MCTAALAKAAAIGVPETVCVCDDGGYPIALERMDGARITGPQIAWNCLLDRLTSLEYASGNTFEHQPGIMLGTLALNLNFTAIRPN